MVPIVSRLKWYDYEAIFFTVAILVVEKLIRFIFMFFPYSMADWVRFKLIGLAPRLFRGFSDEADESKIQEFEEFDDTVQLVLKQYDFLYI